MAVLHVLREYALIADGERGALVGPAVDISWLCFPRWDSPAVFAGLLGGRGEWAVTPVQRHVWGGYYEPGSLIWRNRWVTDDAIIECRDALALPAHPDRAVLLRRIEVRRGQASTSGSTCAATTDAAVPTSAIGGARGSAISTRSGRR